METFDAITSRRNIREYEDRPIPTESLQQILEAGRRTPSSSNQQRWDFVVVQDRDRLDRLSQVWKGAGHIARAAAAIGIVAPVTDDFATSRSIHYDWGQATMSLMLAAADLGIGTAHASVSDQALAREILGLPEERELAWMMGLGFPADRPLRPIKNPTRRPLAEVVHYEGW